jgi:hypothetical protein
MLNTNPAPLKLKLAERTRLVLTALLVLAVGLTLAPKAGATTRAPAVRALKQPVAHAANVCPAPDRATPYFRNYDYGNGFGASVNVGLCTNGRTVWAIWGPDCKVDIPWWDLAIYGYNVTWCGVYNNGGRVVQPGFNADITFLHIPGAKVGGAWVRFTAWPWGMNYGAGNFSWG